MGTLGTPFRTPLGGSWEPSWGEPFGGSTGDLGGVIGNPWGPPLGAQWDPWEAQWGPRGPPWGAHWGPLGSSLGIFGVPPCPPLTGATFPPQAMSAPPAPPEEPPLSPPAPGVSGVSGGGLGGGGGLGAAPLSAASLSRLRSRLRRSPASCRRSGGAPVSCPPPSLLRLLPSRGGNPGELQSPRDPAWALPGAGGLRCGVGGAGGREPPPGPPHFSPPAPASLGREQRGGAESAGGMGGAGGDPARYPKNAWGGWGGVGQEAAPALISRPGGLTLLRDSLQGCRGSPVPCPSSPSTRLCSTSRPPTSPPAGCVRDAAPSSPGPAPGGGEGARGGCGAAGPASSPCSPPRALPSPPAPLSPRSHPSAQLSAIPPLLLCPPLSLPPPTPTGPLPPHHFFAFFPLRRRRSRRQRAGRVWLLCFASSSAPHGSSSSCRASGTWLSPWLSVSVPPVPRGPPRCHTEHRSGVPGRGMVRTLIPKDASCLLCFTHLHTRASWQGGQVPEHTCTRRFLSSTCDLWWLWFPRRGKLSSQQSIPCCLRYSAPRHSHSAQLCVSAPPGLFLIPPGFKNSRVSAAGMLHVPLSRSLLRDLVPSRPPASPCRWGWLLSRPAVTAEGCPVSPRGILSARWPG